jgi:uncharacterized protein (TIGR02611 family)
MPPPEESKVFFYMPDAPQPKRSLILRTVWVIAGFTVLLAGIIMIVTPGPAVVFIPMGLAILATEYAWARRSLDRFKQGGKQIGSIFFNKKKEKSEL